MDCSAEEQMVRMKLESIEQVAHLEFDLLNRELTVYHTDGLDLIRSEIAALNFSDTYQSTVESDLPLRINESNQRKILVVVLLINAGLFGAEMVTGIIAQSMGLVADSLDMLADAMVYGLSLFAVGKALSTKKRIATTSGYFQIALALMGFAEIIRRSLGYGDTPEFKLMIVVSIIALIGNSSCLLLLKKEKSEEAHMKASWIFTTNDIIVNLGVIIAGVLVWQFESRIPDLAIGLIVFIVVIRGAFRILKLGKG
jgi:Co/Zn/Cd efflux system component